jgi:hypothetical protein
MNAESVRAVCRRWLTVCGVTALAVNAGAVRWDWYAYGEAAGGGYFYGDKPGSYGAALTLTAIPAFSVSERLSIVPFYSFEYRGVRDVRDLLGGGTLVQQAMTSTVYVKPVFTLDGAWKLKPRFGYTNQLLRETQDEEWYRGLFDYTRTGFALEVERSLGDRARVTVSPGFFYVDFYNYDSIAASRYGLELSTAGPGRDLLNFTGYELSLEGRLPVSGGTVSSALYLLQRAFTDQHLVTEDGAFSRDVRSDVVVAAQVTATRAVRPTGPVTLAVRAGLDLGVTSSNQNHYDAARMRYVPDFYGYLEGSVRPGIAVGFNRLRVSLDADYALTGRVYSGRLAQDAQGAYADHRVNTVSHLFRASVRFPLFRSLEGFFTQTYLVSVANTHFEQAYAYNYAAYHVLCGVRYGL